MDFLAPAKINLSLKILGARADGMHEIETLICPVSVFDRLTIDANSEGGFIFTCDDASLPDNDDNLAVRAAKLFCAEVGIEPNLRITLLKEIPHGAGLGGGSSDAATVLLALNEIFQTMLPRETLADLAAELGSDVPFFVHQTAAVCRGRGELVSPIPAPPALPLLLIKPDFEIATAWAYQAWRDSREVPNARYEVQNFDWGNLSNDLERPVFQKYLVLASLKSWLLRQAEVAGALLSGSGSTLFAVLREKRASEGLAARLVSEFGQNLWLYACETIV